MKLLLNSKKFLKVLNVGGRYEKHTSKIIHFLFFQ